MWQCRFCNQDGQRCSEEAIARIYFSNDHPFNHTDVCKRHLSEYGSYIWIQFDIQSYGVN
jgi:hypothetical protein